MDEFLIPGASGGRRLLFYRRSPEDAASPLEWFRVRVAGPDLSADARVYAGQAPDPAALFKEMAVQWRCWSGEQVWESLEGELVLACTHDGLGHVSIGVELRSGDDRNRWRLEAIVMVEAGQLDHLAAGAAEFWGVSE